MRYKVSELQQLIWQRRRSEYHAGELSMYELLEPARKVIRDIDEHDHIVDEVLHKRRIIRKIREINKFKRHDRKPSPWMRSHHRAKMLAAKRMKQERDVGL